MGNWIRGIGGAALLLTALGAHAEGFYASGFGGVSLESKQRSRGETFAGAPVQVDVRFDTGYYVGGAFGYAFADTGMMRLRTELELSYRDNNADRLVTGGVTQMVTGDNTSLSGMANVLIDFTGMAGRLVPYVGVGAGIAGVESDIGYSAPGGDPKNPQVLLGGPTGTEFAYQFILGASYPLSRYFDLFAEGRYWATSNPDFNRSSTVTGLDDAILPSEFSAWQSALGLRWHF